MLLWVSRQRREVVSFAGMLALDTTPEAAAIQEAA